MQRQKRNRKRNTSVCVCVCVCTKQMNITNQACDRQMNWLQENDVPFKFPGVQHNTMELFW